MTQTGEKPPCNNPKGKNQHRNCPAVDDPRIPEILRAYHRQGISDRRRLSKLLRDEHGIIMSESTVSRRRRELGLRASGLTTLTLPDAVKRQLVLDQMAKDPEGKLGAITIKARIFKDTGIDITRDWIRSEMRVLAPTAFALRRPHHKSSPEPQQSTSAHRTPREPARVSIPSASGPSSPARRTVRQSLQNAATISPAPGPSHSSPPSPSHATQRDLYENCSDSNSPLFSPPQDSHADISLDPSLNPNGNETSTATQPIPRTLNNPLPLSSTTLSIPNSDSYTQPVAVLDIINQTTPRLLSLTQSLNNVDFQLGAFDSEAASNPYECVMKCMEAAAMLERQLSRIATGLTSVAR